MTRAAFPCAVATLVLVAAVGAGSPTTAMAGTLNATHYRVQTPYGPVHVYRPAGYDRATAGLVVYVHGLYVNADDAWRDHRLGEQFAASRRNALFIAPEAPAASDEPPIWTDLEALIHTTLARVRLSAPAGPIIVVGHSGAFRTIVKWLDTRTIRHIVLVDALYGNEDEFHAWLQRRKSNRMTLVIKGTEKRAEPFVRSLRYAVIRNDIPETAAAFTRAQRDAKLLCLRSQYGHMELVTEGKTLPVLLQQTALKRAIKSAPPVSFAPPS